MMINRIGTFVWDILLPIVLHGYALIMLYVLIAFPERFDWVKCLGLIVGIIGVVGYWVKQVPVNRQNREQQSSQSEQHREEGL